MYSYLYVTAGLSEASADHPRTSSVQEKCGPAHQSRSIAVTCQLLTKVIKSSNIYSDLNI